MSTNLNVRPYNNKEQLLFPPSIGDYLPKDHLAHVVDEAVDEIDLRPYYKKIPDVGNPSYHPALMIKIWFYGYATKTYSSRKIEEKIHTDVAFIYLAGMQKPDFKAISEFRRKNIQELKDSFIDILQICHRLGMTKLCKISLDSKAIKANVSASRTYDEKELIKERKIIEKAIEEYLEKVNQTDEEEDQKYGADKRGNELPDDIREKEKRIKKMRKIIEQIKQVQEKLKSSDKQKINLTDPDAQFQEDKGKTIPGYRAHIAVDSKEQVIVANDVTTEQSDQPELIPMVDKVIDNIDKIKEQTNSIIPNDGTNNKQSPEDETEKDKIKIIADSGYSSGNNFKELEKEKYRDRIDPYIPDQIYQAKERGKRNSPFDKDKFIYDETSNEFICPAGNKLHYIGNRTNRSGQIVRIYHCNDCRSCKYFTQCTTSPKGRGIEVSENEYLIKKMREKLSTEDGKKIYTIRKITAEPVFGNLSQNLGFREFLLRGKEKVKGEFSLMCTAHNLLKIARFVKELGFTLKEILNIGNLSPVFDTS